MKNNIKIQELIQCISNACSKDEYIDKIKQLNLTKDDFNGHINYSKERYTRTCIANENDFELILLAWSKGQKTPIHNHDGHEGFVYAIEGKLEEVTFILNEKSNKLEKISSGILIKNELSYAKKDINGFHSIENIADDTSLTLHLYKKPIESCLVYNEEENKLVTRNLVYDFSC